MARGESMYARAGRRVPDSPNSFRAQLFCPYCHRHFQTAVGRDRHVTFRPICNFRHKQFVNGKKKRKADADTPVTTQPEGEPPTKRPRTDENTSPVAGPSTLPPPDADPSTSPPIAGPSKSPLRGDGPADSNPHVADRGDGVFVEAFPVDTAGTPIGTRQMSQEEVEEYLKLVMSPGKFPGFSPLHAGAGM